MNCFRNALCRLVETLMREKGLPNTYMMTTSTSSGEIYYIRNHQIDLVGEIGRWKPEAQPWKRIMVGIPMSEQDNCFLSYLSLKS